MLDAPGIETQYASHFELIMEARESPDQVKKQALSYMAQLEGWCSREKGSILIDLVEKVKPEVIVEIGVWGGKSFVPMATVLRANRKGMAYGIDPWKNEASIEATPDSDNKDWWATVDHTAIMETLIRKITEFDLDAHVVLIQNTSEDAPPIYDIDILHIDGNHSDKTSYFDVTKWVPLVKEGGWIIFDDMTWHENNVLTTTRAVKWLNDHCVKIAEFHDLCDWGIWAKPLSPSAKKK